MEIYYTNITCIYFNHFRAIWKTFYSRFSIYVTFQRVDMKSLLKVHVRRCEIYLSKVILFSVFLSEAIAYLISLYIQRNPSSSFCLCFHVPFTIAKPRLPLSASVEASSDIFFFFVFYHQSFWLYPWKCRSTRRNHLGTAYGEMLAWCCSVSSLTTSVH